MSTPTPACCMASVPSPAPSPTAATLLSPPAPRAPPGPFPGHSRSLSPSPLPLHTSMPVPKPTGSFPYPQPQPSLGLPSQPHSLCASAPRPCSAPSTDSCTPGGLRDLGDTRGRETGDLARLSLHRGAVAEEGLRAGSATQGPGVPAPAPSSPGIQESRPPACFSHRTRSPHSSFLPTRTQGSQASPPPQVPSSTSTQVLSSQPPLSPSLQITMYSFMGGGLFCAWVGTILLVVATATDHWMQYRLSGSFAHQGLWRYCLGHKCYLQTESIGEPWDRAPAAAGCSGGRSSGFKEKGPQAHIHWARRGRIRISGLFSSCRGRMY
ncbi:Hypothetical predicted protein [Marmota monax]|uniref:Lens fiber membrane intrinsic protein n=1 Tax=Marmota monax TaxID=9995 RepID=A0A5E4BWC2_MARMO|nr:hypothetical protein GHT09_010647 [Marmota monax]VTJ73927.1 Hypothetical predicted protein [Marmota monax]